MSRKAVVIFSGGLDSTVLLAYLRKQGFEVYALSVDYGQRHRVELEHAHRLTQLTFQVPHKVADLRAVGRELLAGSSQTSDSIEVPQGHYAEESMKLTVVPNRNMIMLSVAIGWAVSLKAEFVAYGAHGGDHTIYPDCRPEFVEAMQTAAGLADWHPVAVTAPFLNMTKADIVKLGAELGAPMHKTWSCYDPRTVRELTHGAITGYAHCGECGTCVERKEAFLLAGVTDPTTYNGTGYEK